MTPLLTVVVVTWNCREDVLQCLRSLAPVDPEWEIWVVDNASADHTVAAVRTHCPRARVIANAQNVGFARANNQVIDQTESRYVLLLNPDTELSPAALRAALAEMETRPRAGIVALQLRNTDGSLQPSCFRFPSPWMNLLQFSGTYRLAGRRRMGRMLLAGWWAHDEPRAVDWVVGAFMLVRREAIDAIGGVPEEYYLFGEDMEWCHRIWQRGYEVWFTPRASLIHHFNRSAAQRPPDWRAGLTHDAKYRFCLRRYGRIATRFIQLTDLAGYSFRRWRYALPTRKGNPERRRIRELMTTGQRAVWSALRARDGRG